MSQLKDPNYFSKYYQDNKQKYYLAKKKFYAINKCGLDSQIAQKLGDNVMIAGRFQKIYMKMKEECPETLQTMLDYLSKMETKINE